MAEQKEHLADLVPQDCKAIHEIIAFAEDLAKHEKEEGWKKHQDANALRTPLSKQLSSIVTGKLEKGCSWYDFAPDSAWVTEGGIDEVSLRVFKAARIFSVIKHPGKHLAHHDAFACFVTAATCDEDIAEKVARVRNSVSHRQGLDETLLESHELSNAILVKIEKHIPQELRA